MIRCIALFVLLMVCTVAVADSLERPKIGLALSGGGARGAAHVGVLKQLEAFNIPVDYIAGTSIGSVVGGLYASGYTAAELERLIAEIDWGSAFSDNTYRASLPMRQKLDGTDFLVDFELGFNKTGISIPKGVIQGQELRLILNRIFRGVMLVDDFDNLPIPFRAVASDIENGEPVVLGKGDIARSVMASMAVPGVFSPVEIDGKVLVDGGVTNNLPIDVVRSMGADIIIAVDISTPLTDGQNLLSALDILDQLTNILNQTNVQVSLNSLTGQDFFIQPDLRGITSADFNLVQQGVKRGEQAVQRYATDLSDLALDGSEYQAYRDRVIAGNSRTLAVIPDYISIRQNSSLSSELIRSHLRTVPGKPIDQQILHDDIRRVYGLDFFQTVSYHLEEENGLVGLVIDAREKDWGPNYLKFGLQLEDDFEGGDDYNLLVGLSKKPINTQGGELSATVKAGGEPKISAEFFQPFDSAAKSYGLLSVSNGENSVNIYTDGLKVATYRLREAEAAAFLGVQHSSFLDIRLGLKRLNGTADLNIGDGSFSDNYSFNGGSVALELRYDSLDARAFPGTGYRGYFFYERNLESLGADSEFTQFTWGGVKVFSVGKFRLGLKHHIAATIKGEAPVQSLNLLGGFQNLSGYAKNELAGQHAGLIGVSLYHPVLENYFKQIEHPVYLGGSFEAGNVWIKNTGARGEAVLSSVSVFVGTQTPIGPMYLGFGRASEGQSSLYFSLGRLF